MAGNLEDSKIAVDSVSIRYTTSNVYVYWRLIYDLMKL